MRMLFGRLLVLFAALTAVAALHAAESDAPLKIKLTAHEYPPFMSEKLPYGGLLTRIVREAFKAANVEVEIESLSSNNRVITGVMVGLYDGAYGWAHSPERDRKLHYSKSSIFTFRMVFFQRRGMEIPWESLSDLGRYQIGATLGNHYSEEFSLLHAQRKLKVQEASSDRNNMRKLLLGRIDLFPMEEEAGQMLILQSLKPAEQANITFQAKPIALIPTYLVLRRDLPNAAELLERFDQGYKQLSDSGQLARILGETRKALVAAAQHSQNKRNQP
ncbi:substrate-binding periplasmic protein [Pseudoduganella sp.]|uniref:substrate-binding periplasmic protein n=1 Tax=Pseudoduganella sp. TaxID=1880898 RepID=UPI0035ADA8FC